MRIFAAASFAASPTAHTTLYLIDMRLIKMTGGLGNQMFIYAMHMAMRKRFPDTRVDLSDMMHYNVHNGYELHRIFHLPADEVCLPQWLKKVVEFLFFKTILERKQNLDTLEAYRRPYRWPLVYFKGFYQDEKYFADCADDVRRAFSFDADLLNDRSRDMLAAIDRDQRAVSLHVRRGDYLHDHHWRVSGCVCQLGYYQRAVARMLSLCPDAHFYVFSDDIDWVKAHLRLPADTVYVDWNRKQDSWQDMMLMSRCRHNVICNSSFSWWGAWLNSHAQKIVVCPARWQAGKNANHHIIVDTWEKVETDDAAE